MRKLLITIFLMVSVNAQAKDLPKELPSLTAKQEKITKRMKVKNSVVIPRYSKSKKNRSIASSEIVAVSDPMFAMKPQK